MPRGQHERARSGGKDAESRHGVTSRRATERRFVTGYVTGVTELSEARSTANDRDPTKTCPERSDRGDRLSEAVLPHHLGPPNR